MITLISYNEAVSLANDCGFLADLLSCTRLVRARPHGGVKPFQQNQTPEVYWINKSEEHQISTIHDIFK
jgi:hypothetical protein